MGQVKHRNSGLQVGSAFATNYDVVEWMILREDSVPEEGLESPQSQEQGGRDPLGEDDPGVRLYQATTGQLGPKSRAELLGILAEYNSKRLFDSTPKLYLWYRDETCRFQSQMRMLLRSRAWCRRTIQQQQTP